MSELPSIWVGGHKNIHPINLKKTPKSLQDSVLTQSSKIFFYVESNVL